MRTRIDLLGKASLDDLTRKKIQTITKRNVRDWKRTYDRVYEKVIKERTTTKKDISHKRVDNEVKIIAGLKELKQNLTIAAKSEIVNERFRDLPNDRRRQVKAIENYVHRLVNRYVTKISDNAEKLYQGHRIRSEQLKKKKLALIDYRIAKQRSWRKGGQL
ncbi:MAG: hypothetical protein ACFFCQ_10155 [Promethearchaeota archaeon]